MPAACWLSGRLSMRKASMTISCVAEAVATKSAAANTTYHGARAGSEKASSTIETISRSCENKSQRRIERVDDRRPQKLDGVGRADQREQADDTEIDAHFPHPHQQRGTRQRQRQPGGEAEEEHDQHARLEIDRERVGKARARGRGIGRDGHRAAIVELARRHKTCRVIAAKSDRT